MKSITIDIIAEIALMYNFKRVSEDVYFYDVKTSQFDTRLDQKILMVYEKFDDVVCVSVYENDDVNGEEKFYITDVDACYVLNDVVQRHMNGDAIASIIYAVEHFFQKYSLNSFCQ